MTDYKLKKNTGTAGSYNPGNSLESVWKKRGKQGRNIFHNYGGY
jgi:N-methylhydantoinase B/oxoprolinase/acetone carboxylase alpha subunit